MSSRTAAAWRSSAPSSLAARTGPTRASTRERPRAPTLPASRTQSTPTPVRASRSGTTTRRSSRPSPRKSSLRAFALAAFLACVMLDATAVRANPAAAVIEIDPRAEALIDPRALRRRVQLELADVTVPPPLGQSEAALFFRVLALSGSELKIELWERGVAYGSHVVAGGADAGPLLARRVALAAAELARELSDTREDEATERAEAAAQRAVLERAARERTRDGPRALRPGVSGAWAPKFALA